MKKILFLKFNNSEAKEFLNLEEFSDTIQSISQYEVEYLDFNIYNGIFFTHCIDQYLLKNLSMKFRDFLQKGGKIFYNGHIMIPFLDELTKFQPILDPKYTDFFISEISKHQIYDGIVPQALNVKKGVAGFYSRGQNPPPKKAKIITAIKNGEVPVDWELKIGSGMLYIHCGNDLHGCAENFDISLRLFRNIIRYLGEKNE